MSTFFLREINLKFANFLEAVVCERKISINKLSRKSGVSRQSLYRWLSGDRYPDAKNVIAINEALGLNASDTSLMLQYWIKDNELNEVIELYLDTTLMRNLK